MKDETIVCRKAAHKEELQRARKAADEADVLSKPLIQDLKRSLDLMFLGVGYDSGVKITVRSVTVNLDVQSLPINPDD